VTQLPGDSGALWYDDEAGPMVRPYTVTRGRTHSPRDLPDLDVIALISLSRPFPPAGPTASDAGGAESDAGRAGSGGGTAGLDGGTAGADVGASGAEARAEVAGGVREPASAAGAEAEPGGGAGESGAGGDPASGPGGGVDWGGGADPGGGAGSAGAVGRAGSADGGSVSGRSGSLGEEHLALLERCRAGPISVAELAAEADLPLGVVRVLIGDLIHLGRVRVTSPVPPAELPDIGLLQHLISALKAL
jgi:Protein of unknown function (DUF742)